MRGRHNGDQYCRPMIRGVFRSTLSTHHILWFLESVDSKRLDDDATNVWFWKNGPPALGRTIHNPFLLFLIVCTKECSYFGYLSGIHLDVRLLGRMTYDYVCFCMFISNSPLYFTCTLYYGDNYQPSLNPQAYDRGVHKHSGCITGPRPQYSFVYQL